MRVLALLLVFYSVWADSILRDGDFETFGSWELTPIQIWCDEWCLVPLTWFRKVLAGKNFISVSPNLDASIVQRFNQTHLAELYDSCTLQVYVRARTTADIQMNVVWASVRYPIEWFDVVAQTDDSTWTPVIVELSGVSSSLAIEVETGAESWLSLDNATLECKLIGFFGHLSALKISLAVIAILIVFATVRFLYTKNDTINKWMRCRCCPCRRNAKFVQLQEDVMEMQVLESAPEEAKSISE